MKLPLFCRLAIALLILISITSPMHAQTGEAILERYVLNSGQNGDGIAAAVLDKYFGGGTARASVAFYDTSDSFDPSANTGSIYINVSRRVPEGTITFALLCFHVEVRGYDASGKLIYARSLPGFTFGDSKSGRYVQSLRNLPLSMAQVRVTFYGNYE